MERGHRLVDAGRDAEGVVKPGGALERGDERVLPLGDIPRFEGCEKWLADLLLGRQPAECGAEPLSVRGVATFEQEARAASHRGRVAWRGSGIRARHPPRPSSRRTAPPGRFAATGTRASHNQTSSGYQASASRTAASSPESSWYTAPPVTSSRTCCGVPSQCQSVMPVPRIEAERPAEPVSECHDDHVVGRRYVVPAVVRGPAAELGRKSCGDSASYPFDVLRSQEEMHAGTPAMIGRARRVESENVRARADERGGVRYVSDRLRDDVFVERPGELDPGRELGHESAQPPWRSRNASVRFQASLDASAYSSYLRSKKLCGAPG